ncbi:MAG: transketolase [Lentimicrobium sp.]|jgi:transketolase|nr:transketolase [Lentimicrobium sp.]MDD2527468.1 transketolase [Lentimicrobiaceae bacterium]MDD4597033.1 transketolase [Lentimicrobiaceae bacterium]MDY0024806.1 transketolase [Lentimicrobium sp.]HAH57306.1 transketolase [Bacteroidales bacterium]
MEIEQINLAADNIRILSAAMVEKARSGHPGGAMGGADFINILYAEFLRYDPADRQWFLRDRFFLDPGHMSAMLYSVLTLSGTFTLDDLKQFRQWGSCTPGHPELDLKRGIENTSGPLGQGHTMAVGAAIAERFLCARFGEWMAHKTYTYISDGGIQEEISQAAGRIAGNLGLSNLIMFYDSNDVQLSTKTHVVSNEDTGMKYKAWGWNVIEIVGNDAAQIRSALIRANQEQERPTLIIGKTIMGKGALADDDTHFEGEVSTHGMPLSDAGASFEKTIRNLGGNPGDPFYIFPQVAKLYAEATQTKREEALVRKAQQKEWEKDNPELARKLHGFLNLELNLDFSSLIQKENIATRAASSTVLTYLAREVGNMIVASADLANSDKTDGFLKETKAFEKGDFSGAFLQVGVSELTMAAIANGIALHGGVHVCCGTFFAFSDYMKPAVRLSALMELPVKFLWTHDAFRVGEDGPTHQPVEQEAQIRLLEKLKNHSGQPSTLVLRPADADETTVAWQMAMENQSTPTALILSRQGIKSLPAASDTTYRKLADHLNKGAYIVAGSDDSPKVVLIASGSEVATLVEGARLLRERKNWKVRVVSVISEGLFRSQPAEYQQQIIPDDIPAFGLTAGLPVTLSGLVGCKGSIWGLDHFGYSAPAAKLDEMFGFTPENVFQQVVNMFEKSSLN